MCAQDLTTETSAATMSVNVGSSMDPVELQGLAHFLEHMLFMGTEKYPDEDEYKTYISQHSGDYNASTDFFETTFYFDIANNAFEGALDRLASFFTSPLFKKDCVDRELCAVDSEYKGMLNNDFWRSHQIKCKLSDPSHPRSKFMIGSIETLKQGAQDHNLDLHEELVKFHKKYYSSDIMKLVVCGNHSLDQLVEWAASKFSGIKSNGDNVDRDIGHPVTAEFLGKAVYYETVNDVHKMEISFPVPDTKAMYRSDPFNYISHFVNHKGQGSLMAYLKQQGWATHLGAGASTGQTAEFSMNVFATPDGLDHYEDILRAIFAYVRLLISSGPQEWVQQEISSIAKNEFDNRVKTYALGWVIGFTRLIHNEYVEPKHVLSKDRAYEKFDYEDILHCLSFINPDNFRVFLGALKHKSVDCLETEPYFGGAYHVDNLSADLLKELASDNIHVDGLSLPEKNECIPDDFSIKNPNMLGDAAVLRPTLLRLNDNFELWFKQDDQFNSPKGSTFVELGVTGYSNKLSDLLAIVLESATSFKVDDTQLSIHLAKYKQSYANIVNERPSQLCAVYKRYITETSEWHHQLLESELAKITPAKLQAHVDSLFDVTFIKMCMVGNFDEEEALSVADNVQAVIKPTPNLGYDLSRPRDYNIEPGYYVYQLQVPNEDCVDSAVQCNIYCGPTTDKRESALLDLLEELVHDGFFAQIRTKHQLGYRVSAASSIFPFGRSELALRVEGESNPITASEYTRIDVQMWSTKIWKPTVSDFKAYSAKTLALYGCLHSEGNGAMDICKVDKFITAAIDMRKEAPEITNSANTLLEELKSASLSESGAMYAAGESSERATHTGTALELAIRDHETFGNYADVSRTDFATISMDKTPDGLWLLTDYRKFQATQRMYGSALPAEVLVPKYSS
ncbi:metalloprotease [Coemansia sp. 'formosensis']|nr:metalloprotease [Coemansia sp. 'formosensis']